MEEQRKPFPKGTLNILLVLISLCMGVMCSISLTPFLENNPETFFYLGGGGLAVVCQQALAYYLFAAIKLDNIDKFPRYAISFFVCYIVMVFLALVFMPVIQDYVLIVILISLAASLINFGLRSYLIGALQKTHFFLSISLPVHLFLFIKYINPSLDGFPLGGLMFYAVTWNILMFNAVVTSSFIPPIEVNKRAVLFRLSALICGSVMLSLIVAFCSRN